MNTIYIDRKGSKQLIPVSVQNTFEDTLDRMGGAQLIKILQIPATEIEEALEYRTKSAKEYLKELFEKRWFFRESGERVILKDVEIQELNFASLYNLKRRLKAGTIGVKETQILIEWFTKDYSEVYWE